MWNIALLHSFLLLTLSQIQLMPFLRTYLALLAHLTRTGQSLFIDDVQYNLGIYITAGRTHTRFRIRIIGRTLEIGYRIYRITVVYGVTSPVQ